MVDMMAATFDYIVVGSGPGGVMCAQTLVEFGKKVLLIDAGLETEADNPVSANNYCDIRKNSYEQEELFLGENFQLLQWESGKEFSQMTPQRQYTVNDAKRFLPIASEEFAPIESLATGGLGNAWGLGCFAFSDAELIKARLNPSRIRQAYQVIADRIGISYSPDDIRQYTVADLQSWQGGITVDSNAQQIMRRYHSRRNLINRQSFYAGIPPLALLTEQKENRMPTDYSNMDFYYNFGDAAYRPSLTIKLLQTYSNFIHQRGILVTSFEEKDNLVQVNGKDLKQNHPVQFNGRKLVLACNVFGTARIVLRSLDLRMKLPLLCNPYSMLATLQLSELGKVPSKLRTSTAQVCLFYDEDGDNANVSMASVYSYSSLMLFRLLKKSPLNFRDSLHILKYLQSALVIAGIHHPSVVADSRYITLERDDTLKIVYSHTREEMRNIKRVESRFARVLRQLGCIPFRGVHPPAGSSAHYAGTLPFSEKVQPLSLSPEGALAGTQNVFVADASGFNYLPAKGPTLTIMANAHNIAENIIKDDD